MKQIKASCLNKVIVSLGSNLGDSVRILSSAVEELKLYSNGSFAVSSYYKTSPVDCPPGSPPFLNAVAVFEPRAGLLPENLLKQLQELERKYGRRPKVILNEPRPLDLDIIVFQDIRSIDPKLTLPHPRAHLRRFVLEPLNELEPDLVFPGHTQTVNQFLTSILA